MPVFSPSIDAALRGTDLRFIVTGAGGWLGLATLDLLHQLLGADFASRVVCFGSSARRLLLINGVEIAQEPLQALDLLPPHPSLVLHLAFLTREKSAQMPQDDYVRRNQAIAAHVRAALDRVAARAVFVPSSGAVYAALADTAQAPAHLYGRMKLANEALFAEWARVAGRRTVIARIFNISGPYINKTDRYALASMILDVLARRPIEIRAAHPVRRSYVAIRDLMTVVLFQMLSGPQTVCQFDTAGDAELELAELAEAVQDALDQRCDIQRPPMSGLADRYIGNAASWKAACAAAGVTPCGIAAQIRLTADYLGSDRANAAALSPASQCS